ncbi:phage tail family protein [Liquorilactobacillus mali]|uniref:phage tail domain-containing protein n=1 Tax=Liquorilactobacillus mali TaxID=1618 RepID=UPI00264DD74D|nr:phage tail domain-containing protein [Liquorilactobacillus mali]MDN7145263.1 phage tail family protein [Liquorilactobacillus mali]
MIEISEPWLKLKIGDADEVDVSDVVSGLKFLGDTESPAFTNNYMTDTTSDGSIFSYSAFNKNTINARFSFKFSSWTHFKLILHDIYKLFMNRELMRMRTDSEPTVVKYVRSMPFDIAPMEDGSHDATFTIPFENPSGYKYSLVNSDVLKTYSTGVWANYGQNLPYNEDTQYTFSKQHSFKVYNASDIAIDPYYQHHELSIIIKHVGTGFTITNKTNGTSYTYFGTMTSGDELILQGLSTYKNGVIDSNNSDYGYLKLETGWNEIKVTGASDATITFSFPFIYIG